MLQDSDRSSTGSPEPATGGGALHEHQMMIDDMKNSRKRRRSPSPENLHQAKRAAVAQAHLNGTSKYKMSPLHKTLYRFFFRYRHYYFISKFYA